MPSHTGAERRKRRREQQISQARGRDRVAVEGRTEEEQEKGRAEATEFIKAREKAKSRALQAGATQPQAERAAAQELEGQELSIQKTPEQVEGVREELAQTAEEERVFEQPIQEIIIPPEQENLGVIMRIAEGIIPEDVKKVIDFFDLSKAIEKKEALSQAEITMSEQDLQQGVEIATSQEIDKTIEDTEAVLIQNGIPILPVVATAVVSATVVGPVSEFVGTDGQIRSLETALSQYNEMITIPARSVEAGLSPEMAFDKLDRMEDGILALEQQLKLSAQTSPKVALALRGRAVEARLLKLKTKLQEARLKVFQLQAQEAFGEREITDSVAFLRSLQNQNLKGG